MQYLSTRGSGDSKSFSQVVLEGLARDGGLYLPASLPDCKGNLSRWSQLDYRALAVEIFTPFMSPDLSVAEIKTLVEKSYQGFDHPAVTPLVQAGGEWILELFHGPTFAFKDVALQLLGNLFELLLQRQHQHLTILGATSGDTGSAAIYGVRGRANIDIFMLHPQGRVSPVQERQMTSVLDANVHNIAVAGTFDDCQALVKDCFNDLAFRDAMNLGAVNSINWARVLAQIVYFFYAAFRQIEATGQSKVSFSVPTGNFGDIFAGYLARRMGLPMEHLILATNSNDILSRAVNQGDYSQKGVTATYSPSMDIQLASNFERYLYYLSGKQGDKTQAWMNEFARSRALTLKGEEFTQIQQDFKSSAVSEAETLACIKETHQKGYLLDPHTAVGVKAAQKLGIKNAICLATAHPAKFEAAVTQAIGQAPPVPPALTALAQLPTRCAQAQASKAEIQYLVRKLNRG